MAYPEARQADTRLGSIVGSRALARLLICFSLYPELQLHFRALQRRTGLGIASLQAELARLVALGLVARQREGRRVIYCREARPEAWAAIRELIRVFADPVEVLREAFAGIPQIELAFVFGSCARGDAAPDSDVDVFVLGDGLDSARVGTAALEASVLIGRDVSLTRHTRQTLGDRRRRGSVFLRSVLNGPKHWIVGDARALRRVA